MKAYALYDSDTGEILCCGFCHESQIVAQEAAYDGREHAAVSVVTDREYRPEEIYVDTVDWVLRHKVDDMPVAILDPDQALRATPANQPPPARIS